MNTGGAAFPGTLLDWYAGQALAGMLADSEVSGKISDIAASAYIFASAMLAEKARREAVVQESSTTDHSGDANKMATARGKIEFIPNHSPDAGKMAELEAANRELVEALGWVSRTIATTADHKSKVALTVILRRVDAILAKHKGVA